MRPVAGSLHNLRLSDREFFQVELQPCRSSGYLQTAYYTTYTVVQDEQLEIIYPRVSLQHSMAAWGATPNSMCTQSSSRQSTLVP